MIILIKDVLTPEELNFARTTLAAAEFVDGRATAGKSARLVKNNLQAKPDESLNELHRLITHKIADHMVFSLAVRPRKISPLLFSRYGPGHAYGTHVDDAIMRGMRTDVSFTLFLQEPETYEGGELVIESTSGEDPFKLPAGGLIVYPSTTLHRVAEVTQGERLVAVGWARSMIRHDAQRELLYELDHARRSLFDREGKTSEFDLLSKCTSNLIRMWAED